MPITECGCYTWLGHHNHGYAIMTYGSRNQRKMERVTRFLMNAPKGMEVDHLCHQRWCVNPDHLEIVTHLENIHRHFAWKVANRQFCEKHGEQLKYEGKFRVCRTCKREHLRQWKQEQRKKQGLPPAAPHKGQRKFKCDDCGGPYVRIGNVTGRSGRYGCQNCGRGYPYRKLPIKYRSGQNGAEQIV